MLPLLVYLTPVHTVVSNPSVCLCLVEKHGTDENR